MQRLRCGKVARCAGKTGLELKGGRMFNLLAFVLNAKFLLGFLIGGMGAFIYLNTRKK
jgi:hypothetical protein